MNPFGGRFRSLGLASVTMLALLSGCGSIIPGAGDPATLFMLSPKSTFDPSLPTVDWQLVVEVPQAAGVLATQRIAVTRDPMRIEYFAGVRWIESAPTMIQTLLVESFENSKRIVAVGRQAVGLRSDYVLKSDLREFQAEYIGGRNIPTIRVRINAKIIRMPKRQIMASRTFERLIEAESRSMMDIVRAFDVALGKVIKLIVSWSLTTAA